MPYLLNINPDSEQRMSNTYTVKESLLPSPLANRMSFEKFKEQYNDFSDWNKVTLDEIAEWYLANVKQLGTKKDLIEQIRINENIELTDIFSEDEIQEELNRAGYKIIKKRK